MVSRSTVRFLVCESVEASSGSGVEASSVAAAIAAAAAAAQHVGRQDSLNPVTTVMYHLRETVMMGEKKQKRRNLPWDSFHGKSHT